MGIKTKKNVIIAGIQIKIRFLFFCNNFDNTSPQIGQSYLLSNYHFYRVSLLFLIDISIYIRILFNAFYIPKNDFITIHQYLKHYQHHG